MRRFNGSPESHDGLLDRHPSIGPAAEPVKLSINGVVLADLRPESKHLADHREYLRREGDADRVIKENTALALLEDLERRALAMGTQHMLTRLLLLVGQYEALGQVETRKAYPDWIAEALTVGEAWKDAKHRGIRNDAIRAAWFRVNGADRQELTRLQGVLADVRN